MSVTLNTLYVTTNGAYLHKDHASVVVSVNQETRLRVPLHHLEAICCFGRTMVSPALLGACAEAGVQVAFFTDRGRFQARVEGLARGSVHLRVAQHDTARDAERGLEIARAIVLGKIVNGRAFLVRARREAHDESKEEALGRSVEALRGQIGASGRAESLEELRGHEGAAAREYFQALNACVKRDEPEFAFVRRSRRPPRDRLNAMLSFGYALLLQDCAAAAAGVGLDPALGFLHEMRAGRLSLALDLMEEFRAVVVDRLVLAMVNRRQVGPDDFFEEPTGGWRLSDAARKVMLQTYQDAKRVDVQHSFLEQTVPWGRVPHIQAQLLARTLRGDLDVYPPFTWR